MAHILHIGFVNEFSSIKIAVFNQNATEIIPP